MYQISGIILEQSRRALFLCAVWVVASLQLLLVIAPRVFELLQLVLRSHVTPVCAVQRPALTGGPFQLLLHQNGRSEVNRA